MSLAEFRGCDRLRQSLGMTPRQEQDGCFSMKLKIVTLFLVLGCVQPGVAQVDEGTVDPAQAPVDIQADRLERREGGTLLIGSGNVTITQGTDILKADYVSVNTETYDTHARGNVYIRREGKVFQGDEARYNFSTRQGDFMEFEMEYGPFFLTSEDTERLSENEFVLYDATMTTCGWDSPEFLISASEAYVTQDERLHAKNVVFRYYGVPIFYLPWMTKQIGDSKTNIDVVPGYSSRMGGFALTAYNYELNEYVDGRTRVDYRSKRGLGVGQDFYWGDHEAGSWKGDFSAYYASDDKPLDDGSDAGRSSDLIDSDRYRFRMNHRQGLTSQDTARVRLNYLSDPYVLDDFFDSEFKLNAVPENYGVVTHSDPRYTLSLSVIPRLNDFYSTVNRLPELALEVPSLRIGDTPLFYEGESSLAYLERTFADGSAEEDYDAFRFDSDHLVAYPTRHFDFLNVIPRLGYRATFYDTTIARLTNNVAEPAANEAGVVTGTVDRVVVSVNEEGGELRNLFELGTEFSFKGYKVLHENARNDFDVGLRHVVEPSVNYTFVPEPNLEKENIPQFDGIDQLDKRNDFLLGLRNKWQTKRRGRSHDLLDLNVYTYYRLDPDPVLQSPGDTSLTKEDFSDLFVDAEFRWIEGFWVDLDGAYDIYNSELNTFNAQAAYKFAGGSSLAGEYRFSRDRRDQVAGELNLFPQEPVSYTGYLRYDFEGSNLEEHSHFIRYKGNCVGYGLGVRELAREDGDDEFRVWGQIWLTAFPEGIVDLGR